MPKSPSVLTCLKSSFITSYRPTMNCPRVMHGLCCQWWCLEAPLWDPIPHYWPPQRPHDKRYRPVLPYPDEEEDQAWLSARRTFRDLMQTERWVTKQEMRKEQRAQYRVVGQRGWTRRKTEKDRFQKSNPLDSYLHPRRLWGRQIIQGFIPRIIVRP